ncbi:tail tape measure protein [Erwinia phage MIF8]
MSDTTEQLDQGNVPDILGMSDDELSRFDIDAFLDQESNANGEQPQPEVPEEEQPSPEPAEPGEAEGAQPEAQPGEESPEQPQEVPETQQAEQPATTAPESQEGEPDYKAFYSQVIGSPIKANGREILLEKPEDVISLIQMGANYHEKMKAIKPTRHLVKMLSDNGLTDEAELGFLIDLHKKNPQAIAKLIQDSKIDVMDFDTEQAQEYKPEYQPVSEKELELRDILETHNADTGFQTMFKSVSGWDAQSQQMIADNPQLLSVFNTAKQTGMFDKVMAQLDRERMLGRMAGVTDLQAYAAIEQQILAASAVPATPAPVVPAPAKPDTSAAKKAAAPPRQVTTGKKPLPNPESLFSLSEEEFAKIDPTQFN